MIFPSQKLHELKLHLGSKLRVIKTLQFTFTAQITFVIILLFSVGNIIIFRTTSERLIRNTHLRNRDQITGLVSNIDQWKESTVLLMAALSKQPGIVKLDNTQISASLGQITQLTPDRVWRVFDSQGNLVFTSLESERSPHQKKLLELRHKDYEGFKKARNGKFSWSVAFSEALSGIKKEGCLSADQPIFKSPNLGNKSEVIGTLSFCLPLDKLGAAIGVAGSDQFRSDQTLSNQAIEHVQSLAIEKPDYLEFHRGDYTGRVTYLIFESGNIVFPTATDSRFVRISIQSPRRLATTSWGELNKLVTRRGNFNTFQEINLDGNALMTFAMTSSSGNSDWIAVNVIDKKTIFDPLNKALLSLLVLQFSTLLITSIAIYYVCRQLTRPLNQIIARIQALSNLDLNLSKKSIIKKAWISEINNVSLATNRLTQAIESFSRYLPNEVVRSLLLNERRAELGGTSENVAVMFTDIEDFTSYTESVETQDLFRYLNEYFTELTNHVVANNGTIDKYIGDSLMVMWGMPTPLTNPCELACETAIAVRNASNRLRDEWSQQKAPLKFNTRIGLHYGEAIVGNVGAADRFNYTMVGDTVNVASRLEGANKTYQTNIIVSDALLKQLDHERAAHRFAFRMIGEVTMKGKRKSTLIYELYDQRCSLRQPQIEALNAWNRVMKKAIDQGHHAAFEQLSAESEDLRAHPLLIQLRQELDTSAQSIHRTST